MMWVYTVDYLICVLLQIEGIGIITFSVQLPVNKEKIK